ncbi:phosphatase PAP2 family protein [Sphingomonas sp. LaA6.9]|uniref:phosphatase PAP2 family protein n=1 Tax=Sphingomonas sp. LaA6.9 TaxID=2919914 RepID=UPI001F4FE4CD|nr:phosphatase PAP2 family protein [Sphingomonas sp. LaA6.9]MCJ8158032.1 phosphatase PAP2 family protein [Sphingomonas sp. LaA6.9]
MLDEISTWQQRSPVLWILIFAFGLLTLCMLMVANLTVTNWIGLLPIIALLGATAAVYRRIRPVPAISALAEAVLMLSIIMTFGIILTYAMGTSDMPWSDSVLARWDVYLGFDWIAYARFLDTQPAIVLSALRWSYWLFVAQLLLITIILAVMQRYERLSAFLAALVTSLTVTCFIFALMPAKSAYAFYDASDLNFDHLAALSTTQHIPVLEGLRDGSLVSIDLSKLHGIVTFPSFHACGAALLIWCFWATRWLRYPGIALNMSMLAATPAHGAHYLIDIVAGVLLAALSVLLSRYIFRRAEAFLYQLPPVASAPEAA